MIKTAQIILTFFCLTTLYSQAQPNIGSIEIELNRLATHQIGLNEKVQVNISGITLADFISTIALEHNLNVSVDKKLDKILVNNFYDALVKDIFIFLVKKHQLNIEFTGSIMSFTQAKIKPIPKPLIAIKKINVQYQSNNDFLSFDFKQDTLMKVAEAITRASGKNVIISPKAKNEIISVYIENRPFDNAIEMLTRSHQLNYKKTDQGYYFIDKIESELQQNSNRQNKNYKLINTKNKSSQNTFLEIEKHNNQTVSIKGDEAPIAEIIKEASLALGEHYIMYDIPTGNRQLDLAQIDFESLLYNVLRGTEFAYKKRENYFIIGNKNTEGLRASKLIQLENRTVETVIDLIPKELLADVVIKEFIEMNGFIVSGSYLNIEELEAFIHSVDQVVPMIQIDIIIVSSGKTSTIETGVKGKLSEQNIPSRGDVFPGLNVTLGSESINGILRALNGFGPVNFGLVSSNFYLSLSALETNSVIDITSTPKLSALNGHEASIKVGKTDYYKQRTQNISPTISGVNQQINDTWIDTEANLNVTIKPIVSTDGYVTLEINVQQDDFIQKEGDAPPGKTTQTFQSLVRVKNGEMILMGGLEKASNEQSGSGTPILSRIPIIKWLFSSKLKKKEKSKLHIFIKPTVTY